MQLAAGLPEMLRAPSPHAPVGEQLLADRSTYVAVPRSLQPHFPLTVRWMLRVQAAADVGYRAFSLEFVMTARMHETMARA
jgi:hypothetical protein